MQVREKVATSRNTVFFRWFVAPDGRKVGSLKRRVRSHLARWAMKSCTPLCREAHFQVKMYKTPQLRSTFKNCIVEKMHAVMAQSTFRSQNVQSTWDVEKVCVARSTCGSEKAKKLPVSDHFWKLGCGFAWHAQRCKTWGFCSSFENVGRRGTFEEDLQRCSRVAGAIQETCSGDLLRRVAFSSVRSSGLLRWFCVIWCSTSYDLASLFRRRRSTLHRWSGKIAKRIGMRPSALHSTFYVWRRSHRIASFLMLSNSKIEEVSQNCFVFDVVKLKHWGSLAELLRFRCCQLKTLRKCLSG